MRTFLKYLLPVAVNAGLLLLLLSAWADRLERLFDDWILITEMAKIAGVSLLISLMIGLLFYVFPMKSKGLKTQLLIISSITLLISSILYTSYISKLVHNRIINRANRDHFADKITMKANRIKITGLNRKEYELIGSRKKLMNLPEQASAIDLYWETYGPLPDYLFRLKYTVPLTVEIDTINISGNRFSRYQSFEINDSRKEVTYEEILQ